MEVLASEIDSALSRIPVDFGGGCSFSKACLMASLVVEHAIAVSVDIGVYRGRLLFPLAIAHRISGGIVYGVDPWDPMEAREHDTEKKAEIDRFIVNTDFNSIYRDVVEMHETLGVASHCCLLRLRSDEAILFFEENDINFGLVHIDGNHDTAAVTSDFDLYIPRLKPGGFLVIDDISWDSVAAVYERAVSEMAIVHKTVNTSGDYAIFQKQDPGFETIKVNIRLRRLENRAHRLERLKSRKTNHNKCNEEQPSGLRMEKKLLGGKNDYRFVDLWSGRSR